MHVRFFFLLAAIPLLAACPATGGGDPDDEPPAEDGLESIATLTQDGYIVDLLAERDAFVGTNALWIQVLDEATGEPVDGLDVMHMPMMNMADMSHSCPYTQPVGAGEGLYAADVVFTMASGEMGSWSDTVTLDGTTELVFEDIPVAETHMKKNLVDGDDTWIVTLTLDPEVGVNDFVLSIHQRASMMSFPGVEDATVTLWPFMPDMGHGSEDNVDPVHLENGFYEGQVNLSMTGYWTLDFDVVIGDLDLGTVQYEVNF